MAVELNHTIVYSRDNRESARFLAYVLGLEVGTPWGPFVPVVTANGVELDFAAARTKPIARGHYAFLVSDEEFDAALARMKEAGIGYFADRAMRRVGEINHEHHGRGLYFEDPTRHVMELITHPYDISGR
jgi:catechol 2,3-dioxygenase-like lactoylglutathione lyase family enzyme